MSGETLDPVTAKLRELGVDDATIGKIKDDLGATSVEDLAGLTEADLIGTGMKVLQARKLLAALAPTASPTADPTAELAEGEQPSKAQVSGFAGMLGADPTALLLLMSGKGGDMDLTSMISIASLVNGYNPKRRDLYLTVMGQVEGRLGLPIVVIDGDGSINRELTIEYIEGLEEGRDSAENNIYFDSTGSPHEVIRVGVDAQSIYDADPLNPSRALQKSGMGIGRVNWTNVPLEVRQVAYYAVTKTGEIDPNNDAHQSWLRDKMKPGSTRLVFHGQAPRAISEFNEAARTGSLPTLRVMLSRGPRRPEFMPRRRRSSPADLTGIGGRRDDDI
ncbi:MAG: hypothetical protein WCV85_00750 [Patescibacteria group bacterium]|jgi:hypothetical protein